MIDFLAAAAGAFDGYESQGLDPQAYSSLLSVAGWALLHALLPLIGGLIYARHSRTFLIWVAALAVASFAIHAGQELWSVATYDDYRSVSGALSESATFVFVPAFGAAAIGIFIRKLWARFRADNAAAEVQK